MDEIPYQPTFDEFVSQVQDVMETYRRYYDYNYSAIKETDMWRKRFLSEQKRKLNKTERETFLILSSKAMLKEPPEKILEQVREHCKEHHG